MMLTVITKYRVMFCDLSFVVGLLVFFVALALLKRILTVVGVLRFCVQSGPGFISIRKDFAKKCTANLATATHTQPSLCTFLCLFIMKIRNFIWIWIYGKVLTKHEYAENSAIARYGMNKQKKAATNETIECIYCFAVCVCARALKKAKDKFIKNAWHTCTSQNEKYFVGSCWLTVWRLVNKTCKTQRKCTPKSDTRYSTQRQCSVCRRAKPLSIVRFRHFCG